MDKSAGFPQDTAYEGQTVNNPTFGNYNQPQGAGAPPAYTENAYPPAGYPPTGQAYAPPGQAYAPLPPGQGYAAPPHGQGYAPPPHGQGYAPPQHGQGYPPQGQGYGQPPVQGYGYQQQFHHTNVVVAQPLMQPQAVTGPLPPDHMCSAIFVTLCCFWPTGIVAIMRASDARNALARGDVSAAHTYSSSAKSMITISIIVGIISFVVVAIIIGVYVGIVVNNIRDLD